MRLALLTVIFVFMWGCAGVDVKQDYDQDVNFSELVSYSWAQSVKKNDNSKNTLIKKRIQRYAQLALSSKGFVKTEPEKADFLVDYSYQSKDVIVPSGLSTGVGFGIGSHRHFGGVGLGFGGVSEREIEILRIDVINPKDNSLMWRGQAKENLLTSDPDKTDKNFKRVVMGILEKFPPNPKD